MFVLKEALELFSRYDSSANISPENVGYAWEQAFDPIQTSSVR